MLVPGRSCNWKNYWALAARQRLGVPSAQIESIDPNDPTMQWYEPIYGVLIKGYDPTVHSYYLRVLKWVTHL